MRWTVIQEECVMDDVDQKVKGPRVEVDGENYTFYFEDFEVQHVTYNYYSSAVISTYRNGYHFSFRDGVFITGGITKKFDLDSDLNALRMFESILRMSISKLVADESGTLNVFFSNGAELKIPPADHVENWECRLYPGWFFGASPGGGIWVFGPRQ
jgi:hypothetical protein